MWIALLEADAIVGSDYSLVLIQYLLMICLCDQNSLVLKQLFSEDRWFHDYNVSKDKGTVPYSKM